MSLFPDLDTYMPFSLIDSDNESPFTDSIFIGIGLILILISCLAGAGGDILIRKYHLSHPSYETNSQPQSDSPISSIPYASEILSSQTPNNYQETEIEMETVRSSFVPTPSHLIHRYYDKGIENKLLTEVNNDSTEEYTPNIRDELVTINVKRNSFSMDAFTSKTSFSRRLLKQFSSTTDNSLTTDQSYSQLIESVSDYPNAIASELNVGSIGIMTRSARYLRDITCGSFHSLCGSQKYMWYLGVALTAFLNPLCSVSATTFLPATFIGFSGIQIFFTLILARHFLNEIVSTINFSGVICIASGIALITIFSGRELFVPNVQKFLSYFLTPVPIVFLTLCACFVSTSLILSRNRSTDPLSTYNRLREIFLPAACGVCGALASQGSKASTLALEGIIMDNPSSFTEVLGHWEAFLLFICTIFIALTELFLLNRSLQLYPAIFVTAIMTVFLNFFAAFFSILIFKEYPKSIILWGLGIILTTFGVIFLNYGSQIIHASSYTITRFYALLRR